MDKLSHSNLGSKTEIIKLRFYLKLVEFGFLWKLEYTAWIGARVLKRSKRLLRRLRHLSLHAESTSPTAGDARTLWRGAEAQQESIDSRCPTVVDKGWRAAHGDTATSLPIVFIHYGNKDYLRYSLAQAKRSNPESTVYLLGDATNDCYEFVEHRPFSNYFEGAAEFAKLYRHFNTLRHYYNLFDFQRWFILREFLDARHLTKCLYLDSDTMLYADVTADRQKFKHFDFTLSRKTSGNTFFLNRVEALNEFCKVLTNIYNKKERYFYDKMVAQYAVRRKNNLEGGACDMTAFELYSEAHFGEIGEVALIIDGSVYDPGINDPNPGFVMRNGIKKVVWKSGDPYGIHSRTGEEIRFNSLHFQGRAKRLMEQFVPPGVPD